MALHIEEGEISATDLTPNDEETKEGGDLESNVLPNANKDGIEKDLMGSSSLGAYWVAIVKKLKPNPRVESPGQSSSQGS